MKVASSFDALEAKDDGEKVNKEELVKVAHVKEVESEKLCTKDWVNKSFGRTADLKKSSMRAGDVPLSRD